MVLFHERAETLALDNVIGGDQADTDMFENVLLGHRGHAQTGSGHALLVPGAAETVQQIASND
jgi:hypothetical protein